jgi:hypothetical protein
MAKARTKQAQTTAIPTGTEPPSESIERGDEITTITFHGTKYSFPTNRGDWPIRAVQAFQKRRNADGVELLLGVQQWDLFNERHPTMAEFWEFFPLFVRAAGFMREE